MSESAKVFSTDVLVIGGGIAGLCAANKAADQGADVLIAEKSTAGWGGQMPLAGGAFSCIPTPEMVEAMVKFVVEEGEYLNDQEWTYTFVKDTHPCVQEMLGWGVPFGKEMDGKLKLARGGGVAMLVRSEKCLPTLLGRVLEKGAKVLNKVYMVDLLKRGDRVVGAVGFHYETGDFCIIQSKATILACGGCNYKARGLWHMNCGEGVAMAYNAGAELRNAEFANQFMVSNKYTLRDTRAARDATKLFENALGESMLEKYPDMEPTLDPRNPSWMTGMLFKRWVRAWYKEIEAGKGPIYLNYTRHPELAAGFGDTARLADINHGYMNMMQRLGIDISKEKVEWVVVPEFHAGPIRVDLNCETTLPGLYATGDATQNGSAFQGAVEGCGLTGGVPLGFAMVTGFRAGTAAGKATVRTPKPEFSSDEVEKSKSEIFAPLGKKDGYNPYDAIKEIQEVVFKLKNSFIKHKERLEAALGMIEEIKAKLPNLAAKDSHELVRCHEAKSMVVSAEALYRASLMRTETRGTNVREDYPGRDDKDWLKWIVIKREGEEMKLWTEPVPIEKYKLKPG